jgi:enoyl-[acyl-carrier protein] reductase III
MPAGASIIAMSSLGAARAMPDYGFIGASKAALESLVRTLAQELGPRQIRVNAVSAGVVDTDALRYFPNREELLENLARRTPAGPVLTPQDVAGAVYLLCLPEAAMITGHTLVVDGGFCISG